MWHGLTGFRRGHQKQDRAGHRRAYLPPTSQPFQCLAKSKSPPTAIFQSRNENSTYANQDKDEEYFK